MVPFYRRESNDCHNTECSSEEANFQPGEIRIMRYTRSYHKKKNSTVEEKTVLPILILY